VKVTRLSVEAVSAQVEGQADSKETVTRFRMALLKTKLFKECTIKEGVSPKAGKVDFNLELKRA
jgi:Tfp pilus assembly protein PilN